MPGAGDFASGLLHPILTPAHVIVLLVLGIWLGQRPPLALRGPVLVFAGLSGAALVATLFVKMPANLQPALAVVSLAGGLLVACEATLRGWVRLLPFAAAALALGCDSSADVAPGVSVGKVLTGTWVALSLVLINVAFYVSLRPEKPWARIGLRVIGSWVVAISFLLVAFALRRTP